MAGVCLQRGRIAELRSIQHATDNDIFCINFLIARSCQIAIRGKGSRLNPPKVSHSWRRANSGSSEPFWCQPKGLSVLSFPEELFPHTSAALPMPPSLEDTRPESSCPTLCPSLWWHYQEHFTLEVEGNLLQVEV